MYIEHIPHENYIVFIVYTEQTKSTLQYIQNMSNLHRLCLIWGSHILSSYTKIYGPPSEWQHFGTFDILRIFFVFSWMCFLCACQMNHIYMIDVYCTIIQVCTILRLHTWFMKNTYKQKYMHMCILCNHTYLHVELSTCMYIFICSYTYIQHTESK